MSWWTVPLLLAILKDGFLRHQFEIVIWVAVVLLGVPVLIGALLTWISDIADDIETEWLRAIVWRLGVPSAVRTAEAWNWRFRRIDQGTYVRVRLKDGSTVLAVYDTGSLASSDATLHDIYFERVFVPDEDGWFGGEYPTNQGVWISGDQIESIEFFAGSTEPTQPTDQNANEHG